VRRQTGWVCIAFVGLGALVVIHIKQGGYLVEGGEDASSTLKTVIDEIMGIFK